MCPERHFGYTTHIHNSVPEGEHMGSPDPPPQVIAPSLTSYHYFWFLLLQTRKQYYCCLTPHPQILWLKTIINIQHGSQFLLDRNLGAAWLDGFWLCGFHWVAVRMLAGATVTEAWLCWRVDSLQGWQVGDVWWCHAMLRYLACCVWLSMTLWTVACQAPLSMGFFRREYWSALLAVWWCRALIPSSLSGPLHEADWRSSQHGSRFPQSELFKREQKQQCILRPSLVSHTLSSLPHSVH